MVQRTWRREVVLAEAMLVRVTQGNKRQKKKTWRSEVVSAEAMSVRVTQEEKRKKGKKEKKPGGARWCRLKQCALSCR